MGRLDETLDADLVEKVRAGNKVAFGELVEPHLPRLLGLARRMLGTAEEAEDALQNALASTWVARAKLDPQKPAAAYLTTVTLNKCRDRLRRRKVTQFLGFGTFEPDMPVAAVQPDAEAELADRQELERRWSWSLSMGAASARPPNFSASPKRRSRHVFTARASAYGKSSILFEG